MKYFIQYPVYLDCNLRCPYCFHSANFKNGEIGMGDFTIQEYISWRDKNLDDAEEIVLNPHGGEPFTTLNTLYFERFLKQSKVERIDYLSNGLAPPENYAKLLKYKDRIFRIGFTYHRKVIGKSSKLKAKFMKTVMNARSWGVPIYVKEMLFLDSKPEIVANKSFWNSLGVEFKIQDFKGYKYGEDFEEISRYKQEDYRLLDKEYLKTGDTCSCLPGYKSIMIRGGWQAGDVLACWIDPTVIGNVVEGTYNKAAVVTMDYDNKTLEVKGVPKIYRGAYACDRRNQGLNTDVVRDYTTTDNP